ncbi:MAG: LysR family transcriptional regulator [Polyangiales bacterium]
MDWHAVTFDWNQARAFLVTAEEGSFSAAARALGLTQPTLGRQVAALEEALGVTLFERVGQRLELTVTGVELMEHVRAMGAAAMRVSLSAAGQSESVEGTVTVTASEVITAFLLPAVVAQLRETHPGITLELVAANEVRDLQRREADIAVRNVQPTQPDLFARKLRDTTAHFYAAPTYIERAGPFERSADLARAGLFAFDRSTTMVEGFKALGIAVDAAQFILTTPSHFVQWELCKRGLGVCVMMDDVGMAEPGVRRLFPDLPSIPVPMWLVCHRELHTSRRIRVVFDALAEHLSTPVVV